MLKEILKKSFGFDSKKLDFCSVAYGIRHELVFHNVVYDGKTVSFSYRNVSEPFSIEYNDCNGVYQRILIADFLLALEVAIGEKISASCANDVSIAFSGRMKDVTFIICV